MVRVSRSTQSSIAPLPMRIVTDRVTRVFSIPGPINSIDIPGNRIIELDIANAYLYGIRIVIDDEEYRLDHVRDIRRYPRVDAVIIFDGFLYDTPGIYGGGYGVLPGYTYRPLFPRGGDLVESGKSFIYPGQVFNPLQSPCVPPGIFPGQYPPYGYGPF